MLLFTLTVLAAKSLQLSPGLRQFRGESVGFVAVAQGHELRRGRLFTPPQLRALTRPFHRPKANKKARIFPRSKLKLSENVCE